MNRIRPLLFAVCIRVPGAEERCRDCIGRLRVESRRGRVARGGLRSRRNHRFECGCGGVFAARAVERVGAVASKTPPQPHRTDFAILLRAVRGGSSERSGCERGAGAGGCIMREACREDLLAEVVRAVTNLNWDFASQGQRMLFWGCWSITLTVTSPRVGVFFRFKRPSRGHRTDSFWVGGA